MFRAGQSFKHYLQTFSGQYRVGQLVFWFCLSVVPFLGIVFWYENTQWIYIEHIIFQAGMGLLLSHPLGLIYRAIWRMNLLLRMALVVVLAGTFAWIWTLLRVVTYIWLTSEVEIWNDFGGWYFGAFYIFLCWSALYHGLHYYRLLDREHRSRLQQMAHTKEEQIKRLQAEARAREAQLKMLRYQINPHFLFNTLHAIYALVRLKDNPTALAMIAELGKFLRHALECDPGLHITLEEELTAVQLYINIERVRFSDRLQVNFDITEDAKRAKVPGLLLQPLVENAIKFTLGNRDGEGQIDVAGRVEQGQLVLDIKDNGPGLGAVAQSPNSGTGIGLRNTRERLETLYAERHTFTMMSSADGLHITIAIPYES